MPGQRCSLRLREMGGPMAESATPAKGLGKAGDPRSQTSLPAMLFAQARRHSVSPCLWAKVDGAYRPTAWSDVARQITDVARGLRAAGVHAGDRVMLVSENRPEWFIADLAIMSIGAIAVPTYTT